MRNYKEAVLKQAIQYYRSKSFTKTELTESIIKEWPSQIENIGLIFKTMNNPTLELNPPATIERTISTEMDSPNDIPHDVTIYYCYQMVRGKALVSRSEIEIECAYFWDSQLEHAEQEIDNDLYPTEVIYTK